MSAEPTTTVAPVEPIEAVAPLRDVTGPSALGGGWRRFVDLLLLMSVTEFKRVYFGTVLGYFWSLVRPLALFGVLLFVFTQVFRIGEGEATHYPVLLLQGIVLYTFFQEATTNAVTSVVAQEGIVRKTQFPRLVIPLSTVLTGLFNFGANLVIVLVFIIAFGVDPQWTWFLFPVLVAFLFVFTSAVAMTLSVLYVRFRDVSILWLVFAQALFYATPILYPITRFKGSVLEHILMWSPLAVIFEQARVWVLEPHAPTAVDAAGSWWGLLPALAIFIGVCILGLRTFEREAPHIAEDL
jgi:ABC-2 type transport system permease protein